MDASCECCGNMNFFRVLKEVHGGWAHYPKDQRKFRTKISDRFFYHQISEVTREFINTCEGCQLEKAGIASRTDRDLHHTPPTGPYFRVHVDLCGPFRNQADKKRYIFVCIDAMTKLCPLRSFVIKKLLQLPRLLRRNPELSLVPF
jgi:hypothetical protein